MRQLVFAVGLTGAVQLLVGSPDGAVGVLMGSATELGQLRFGRDQESDADRGAVELLSRAKLPADGMVRFFGTLDRQGGVAPPAFLSSHPPSRERAAALAAEIARRGAWPIEPLALDWEAVRRDAR
jgi:predicted Zn-dependent protease